ncbi:VP1 [Gokushovirus WZ-2015a]|nr:VP1 [Gokushovirus WZ-2015a]
MNPTNIDIQRSSFQRSSSVKTSFNVGQIVPFYLDEVLPGDTFNVKTSKVVRLQTLLTPLMDNMYLDTYFFFVPNRIIWDHWEEFMGANKTSAWESTIEYQIPQITAPTNGWHVGTIADYFGIPTGVDNISVSALPFRAYALIMDEWFRDQNLSDPLNIPTNDTTVKGVNTGVFVSDVAKGGLPYTAAKYHDYFTSCLPAPQKGPEVSIPLGDQAPVYGDGKALAFHSMRGNSTTRFAVLGSGNGPLTVGSGSSSRYPFLVFESEDLKTSDQFASGGQRSIDGIGSAASTGDMNLLGLASKDDLADSAWTSGAYADLAAASSISINSLRLAFQIQKLYEKDARGGTRYIELLKSHFGVTSPDARLQRPEYLGGNRIPININQVVQTSSTADGTTPQGNVSGYSVTADSHSDFTKSFVEHGYIIGVMVVRYDHTYQQGLQRMWSRKDRFDFYWPVLANIGEQPVYNQEIYAQGTNKDTEVFGYQEAWADYRYKPSIVTGEMRSQFDKSLDVWHLADDYSSLPMLSDEWIREDKVNVDRVLAVTSSVSNQLFADIYVQNRTTRPMPMYSIPGLIDHH